MLPCFKTNEVETDAGHPLFFKDLEVPVTGKQYTAGYPTFTKDHKSAMAKYLSEDIYNKYKDVKSEMGVSLDACIKTGVDTPHLGVGVTAGDESCYETFSDLFNPVIKDWHKFEVGVHKHVSNLNADDLKMSDEQIEKFNKYVVSTRVRAARCLKGHFLPSAAPKEDRKAVEDKLVQIFDKAFTGELKGQYFKLGELDAEKTEYLRKNGFLFQKPGKRNLLYFSGAANDWPEHRGIFHNDAETALAWVNEEDHCRIISMSKDGNVKDVFARFCKIATNIEANADCMKSDNLGYIGTCPSNLGTGMRAGVMVKLLKFNEDPKLLEEACGKLDLQPRGSRGEHSAAEGGKWDVSNKQRIGFSEVELCQKMVDGVWKLLEWEEKMAAGEDVKAEIAAFTKE